MKLGSAVQVAVVVFAAMFAANDAMAQFGGGFPGGGGGGRRGGGMGGGMNRGGGESGRNERSVPNRETDPGQQQVLLHELQSDLKLTPAQEPAWNAYLDKINALAADTARDSVRARSAAQLGAMQQFDRVLDSARNRLTALEDVAAAAKTLYLSFNDEQKAIADARLAKLLPAVGAGEGRQPGNLPERQVGGAPDRQTGGRREGQ
jgi:hypothetical protein